MPGLVFFQHSVVIRDCATTVERDHSGDTKCERDCMAGLHALALPERRGTEQRLAGASGGTPPGSDTSGSLSAEMASGDHAQSAYASMRRNNIMFSEALIRNGLRRDDELRMKTPTMKFCVTVSRQPVYGRRLMRMSVCGRLSQLAISSVALALAVGVLACSRSLTISSEPGPSSQRGPAGHMVEAPIGGPSPRPSTATPSPSP